MSGTARRIGKIFAWGLGVSTALGVSALLGVLAVVYGLVFFGDDSNLKKSTIMARINEETNIYMLDEKTQIGSIFADAHRRYVPIDEVPASLINAIIAAEDKNFYEHAGIDPVAIFSAGVQYLKGGRMRGASTLTQQTVRNILGWWDPTMSRKFKEWIAALQLERLYSKRQILEFYLNQFHVSGNGRGVGIAAKYYFNKEVGELDLVEAAFIAGSVKGPSQYDPFIKFTKERREAAIRKAYHRKNYVLRRMYEQGWIKEAEFKQAWDQPVKFNRGEFRSDEVALVHLIRQQMERKEILRALGIEDPRELSGAGLKIYTTIDPEMQQSAQLAVRRNLSRLDTILKGFKSERPELLRKRRDLVVNDFFYGQVATIGGTDKEPELTLSFGDLPTCKVPYDSLMRYAKWIDLPWYQGWQKQLTDMVKKVKIGDVLYVEVKEYDQEKHTGVCEMMKRPRVNGGLIALDKGEVRAVVSGFDTHGFNRAIQAQRQPGSVFKPVVYFAALQLGWSILDRLDNERQIFPFQGRFYYPRADHDTPYKEVSVLWSGVTSENLASVALANRLVEKLNLDQFKQLMGTMDLLPHGGEAPRDYHFRVARAMGVTLDNEGVKEFQLNNAISDLLLDVQYTSTVELQQRLRKMWWGRGYGAEMQSIYLAHDDLSANQKAIKLRLAGNNFQRMQVMGTQLAADWSVIEHAVAAKGADGAFQEASVQAVLSRFRVLPGLSKPVLGYVAITDGERPVREYRMKADLDKLTQPSGRPLNALDMQAIWSSSAFFGSAGIALGDVLVDGWLPYSAEQALVKYVDKNYEEVMTRQDEYDLPRYYQHHDFRIAIGLNYLVNLARAMGVTSHIEPVQSFPLGTNVVTLAEVAKIYQTFVSGKTYKFYEEGSPNQINFIRRIEDRYGNVLFEPKRQEYQLVMPEFGLQMREILQRVVTHGTGRRARAELYLTLGPEGSKDEKKIRIPAFGKTGTTNDYNNANFAGFIPYPTEKGQALDPENAYVLAAYTGYDLNKTMQNGAVKVSGAIGALPAWIGLAKEIIDKKKYADFVDVLDINLIGRQEWPLKKDPRATAVAVDMPRGVIMGGGGADQEAVAMSDSSREGESAFDEYRANVVQTTVNMPLQGGGAPLRMFSPYKLDQNAAKNQPLTSRVDIPDRAVGGGDAAQLPKAEPGKEASSTPNAPGKPDAATLVPQDADAGEGRYEDVNPTSKDSAGVPSSRVGAAPAAPTGAAEDIFLDQGSGKGKSGVSGSTPKPSEGGFVEEELW
jgi:penicillin-binding protein 1A